MLMCNFCSCDSVLHSCMSAYDFSMSILSSNRFSHAKAILVVSVHVYVLCLRATTLSSPRVDLSTQSQDTSMCHCPKNRTTTSGRIPAQANTASSGHQMQSQNPMDPVLHHSHHVTSRPSTPGALSSMTHLLRRPDIRPLHLPMLLQSFPCPVCFASPISRQQVPQTSHSPVRRISDASFSSFSVPLQPISSLSSSGSCTRQLFHSSPRADEQKSSISEKVPSYSSPCVRAPSLIPCSRMIVTDHRFLRHERQHCQVRDIQAPEFNPDIGHLQRKTACSSSSCRPPCKRGLHT